MKLFDFVNSISYNKIDLFETDEKAEKLYLPYLVNKNFSFFVDTIFHANEMNCCWALDKKMQFDFMRFGIRKKKRRSTWLKKETEENIEIIKQSYGYNNSKAQEVLNILGPREIELLKQSLYKGGTNKDE
jgi:hypothetical protein